MCVNLQANSRLIGNDEYPKLNPVSNKGLVKTENATGIIAADLSETFFQAALKKVMNLLAASSEVSS